MNRYLAVCFALAFSATPALATNYFSSVADIYYRAGNNGVLGESAEASVVDAFGTLQAGVPFRAYNAIYEESSGDILDGANYSANGQWSGILYTAGVVGMCYRGLIDCSDDTGAIQHSRKRSSTRACVPQPAGGGGGTTASCSSGGGGWTDSSIGYEYQDPSTCNNPDGTCCGASPIILNLDGGGFGLTGADDPVRFDLLVTGKRELFSWTSAKTRDAFLVLDRSGNGAIDSGAELFGNHTPIPGGTAQNGYLALAAFDDNHDGVIDAKDAVFPKLRLWVDANHNGISEPSELNTLASAGVTSIGLKYRDSRRRDEHDNLLRYWGTATVNGRQVDTCDVFFVRVKAAEKKGEK